MIVVECEQGSPEWHAERAGKATASCFGEILAKGKGITRRNYLDRLVAERLSGRAIEGGFKSRAMEQGNEREGGAVSVYEVRRKVFVDRVGFCRHDTLLAGASPDALIGDDGALEVKCPELSAHFEYLELAAGSAPAVYWPQIQGVLWVCGRRWCDFVSFNPDLPERFQMVVRRVLRDQAFIDSLAIEVKVFLEEVAQKVARLEALCP